ncbi:MAG: sulfite exporter TauE/SafE family protein [Desulfobulbaceae bacterium]|nr:sulfite exporter TauE/SafE family protein [Desulfobulbaceae bacterium]
MDELRVFLAASPLLPGGAVLFCAYLIRGIAGFGSALVAVPLLTMSWPLTLVVPVVGLLDYCASLTHGLQGRRLVRWRDLLPLLPFSFIGVQMGLFLLKRLPTERLALFLALFIFLFALYSLLPLPPLRGSRRWAVPAGLLGGMVGALFGTGGPFHVIYLTLRQLDKGEFRATAAAIFIVDGGFRLVSYLVAGLYTWQTAAAVAAGLPLMAAGLAVGGRIHLTIGRSQFVGLVSFILIGSSIALLIRYGGMFKP